MLSNLSDTLTVDERTYRLYAVVWYFNTEQSDSLFVGLLLHEDTR